MAAAQLFHLAGRWQIPTMPVQARRDVRRLTAGRSITEPTNFGTVDANDGI
jgi:hypothetical protein